MSDDQEEECPPVMAGNEIAIVQVVLAQLTLLEGRLTARLEESSKAAIGRWKSHEEEHAQLVKLVQSHEALLSRMMTDERDEQIRFDARVKPVRTLASVIVREWRTITIVALVIANFIGQIYDRALSH